MYVEVHLSSLFSHTCVSTDDDSNEKKKSVHEICIPPLYPVYDSNRRFIKVLPTKANKTKEIGMPFLLFILQYMSFDDLFFVHVFFPVALWMVVRGGSRVPWPSV